MSGFRLEVLSVQEVHSNVENCFCNGPELEYDRKAVG
jgi:hypothetical protein